MKNIKPVWKFIIAIDLLIAIVVILALLIIPKNLGPVQPFINLVDIFAGGDGGDGGDGISPAKPAYYQIGLDCTTGELVTDGELIQPDAGCDDWQANRFERPFNAVSQDEYYPDLDIQQANFGRDAEWYFLRIALFDPQPETEYLAGTYAMEMDLDDDGRGDFLVLVSEPGKELGKKWSTQGVQIWADSNNDVGGNKPNIPESEVAADGYDTLLFDQGTGDDPNGAWARVFMTGSAYVELAFKTHYLGEELAFKWWVWAGYEGYSPDLFELHDFYSHEQTGDTNKGMNFFPIKDVYALDSSCASMWGATPNPADPDYCLGLSLAEPVDDTCLLLKCAIPFFPCKIPPEIPGDEPCVLPYEEWYMAVWQPGHPNEATPPDEQLWDEYEIYLMDPFCPPDDGEKKEPTPTFTTEATATFTLEATATFTLVPTDTPTPTLTHTPTATKYIPPPVKCTKKYSPKKCHEVGGTYIDGGVVLPEHPNRATANARKLLD